MKTEKILTGYRLKKECEKYDKACVAIVGIGSMSFIPEKCPNDRGVSINEGDGLQKLLQAAGVFNLWFEPVYIEATKDIKEEGQDVMWNELFNVINGGQNGKWYDHVLERLKSKFKITRI